MPPRLAVCSWSLEPTDPASLVERLRACGRDAVQLALDPLCPETPATSAWSPDETFSALAEAGVQVVSGMQMMRGEDYTSLASIRATGGVLPDAHWPANEAAAQRIARLCERHGIPLVTFHAGFLPHEPGPQTDVVLARLRRLADVYAAAGVRIALETGQERAETLEAFLAALDRPEVGVNFDPANMLLYGMGDPVDALTRLLPFVAQVHIKDARAAAAVGEWGTEVVVGAGDVDWSAFLSVLERAPRPLDLVIEREAGTSRVADVRRAAEHLRSLGWAPA